MPDQPDVPLGRESSDRGVKLIEAIGMREVVALQIVRVRRHCRLSACPSRQTCSRRDVSRCNPKKRRLLTTRNETTPTVRPNQVPGRGAQRLPNKNPYPLALDHKGSFREVAHGGHGQL